jgi:hypothetical protein
MLIVGAAFVFTTPVELCHAQTLPSPMPVQPNIAALQAQGHDFKIGEVCKRTSGGSGIIKRDACQRWFCSRTDYQDITERRPNLAAEIGCEWQLVRLHCLCLRPGTPPAGK